MNTLCFTARNGYKCISSLIKRFVSFFHSCKTFSCTLCCVYKLQTGLPRKNDTYSFLGCNELEVICKIILPFKGIGLINLVSILFYFFKIIMISLMYILKIYINVQTMQSAPQYRKGTIICHCTLKKCSLLKTENNSS